MRLLIVTQSVDRDDPNLGAFYCWFDALAERLERLVLIADHVGGHDLGQNVEVYALGKDKEAGRMRRLWRFWEFFSRFYADSDAVLFHQIPEFALAGAPFLLSLKKTTALWYAHKSITRRLRAAEQLVDWVFSSSPEGFRLPSKKVIFTGQAIDTNVFFPSSKLQAPSSPLRLITVGRIAPVKECETMIRAVALLPKTIKKQRWSLTFVGAPLLERDHAYLYRLTALVRDLGMQDRIAFAGSQPFTQIPDMLRAHDIFLNLSATGSLDKAVLEAMSCGLSVITANEAYRSILPAPSFLDRVSPETLAQRIRAVAEEERPNHALRSLVCERHSLDRTIEKILGVLKG